MNIKKRVQRLEGTAGKPEEHELVLVRVVRARRIDPGGKDVIDHDHSYGAKVYTRSELESPPFVRGRILVKRRSGPQRLTPEGEADLVSKLSPEDRARWQKFRARSIAATNGKRS